MEKVRPWCGGGRPSDRGGEFTNDLKTIVGHNLRPILGLILTCLKTFEHCKQLNKIHDSDCF